MKDNIKVYSHRHCIVCSNEIVFQSDAIYLSPIDVSWHTKHCIPCLINIARKVLKEKDEKTQS